MAYTGLRRNEALFLRREDVDLATGLLVVVARRRLKTESSAATVPVPDELAEVLRGWLPACGSEWVFPGSRRAGPWHGGGPGYRPADRLREAGLAVGIEHLTFHGLRHTLGKLMVSRFGRSADQTKTMLRHADVRTTEEHYLHRRDDPAELRRIAEAISFRPPAA